MKSEGSARNQYIATFCVNLLAIGYGFSCGWTSPSVPLLLSNTTPLDSGPLSLVEGSWITANLCLGGFLGNTLAGWTTERFGRKLTAYMAAIPQILAWMMVIFGTNAYYLMASRFLGGFSGGVCYMVIPTFIAEIAEDRIRGFLGSTLVLTNNLGILVMYVLGDLLAYEMVPYVVLPLPLIFMLWFSFIPETPFYLMKTNNYVESEDALRFYRGYRKGSLKESEEFRQELMQLKNKFNSEKSSFEDEKLAWRDITTPHAKKAFLIGFCLMAFNQFSGCFTMMNYTASIFAESGSSLSANASATVVGSIQLLGTYLATILIERAGRKLLLTISGFGIVLGMGSFSAFSFAKSLGQDVSAISWIPLVCFSWVIFIGSVGVLSVPFVMLAELMPQKIKSFSLSLCMNILWLFAFAALRFFPALSESLGMHGTLLLFTCCSLAGTLFVAFVVPETKGQSFDTISKLMS
ncbi:facilitated trehalose transporter Tret1-2 homolog [Uranotaenia lowii]|uniref:facilitated trehalose transporter Tret1-2 homolog n=1 Tax=Uranotaenia lowii TaxID=190385 RepID=UPI002478D35F|nr:facilitated trehalose transporter Tret1-2 homolog [Uranotaenia lowii]